MRLCVSVHVYAGADVSIADNSHSSPLHVVVSTHQQSASALKALDKASTMHEVVLAAKLHSLVTLDL